MAVAPMPAGRPFDEEATLRDLTDAVPQLVWSAQGDGTVDFYSDRYQDYAGFVRGEDGTWDWQPVLHPEDTEATVAAWTHAIATGEPYDIEHRIQQADGRFRWHVSRAVPVRDAAGQVLRWYGSATDIHDLKTAERALQESESRLRATFEAVADAILSVDRHGHVLDLNPAFARLHGFTSPEEARLDLPRFLAEFEAREPGGDPIAQEDTPFSRALHGEVVRDVEMEIRRRSDDTIVFIGSFNAVPVRDPAGRVEQVVITIRDITERRRTEERQRLLAREVDHRARNALSVVQAVLTLTRADSVEEYAAAVRGRVQTIARCHTRLTENRWLNVSLRHLLSDELAPYHLEGPERITCSGPDVAITPAAVQPVSMILHELVTNAVKHGALSVPEGRVAVTWRWLDDGGFHLLWQETKGPPAGPPTRRGVGSTVMSGSARQVGGDLALHWAPEGLRAEITAPPGVVDRRGPGSEAAAPAPLTPAGSAVAITGSRRVLVVEDEALLAAELSEALKELGFEPVGPAFSLEEALRMAATELGLAAAILDVNLAGRQSWVISDVLTARGVPHLFASGYGDIETARGRASHVLQKPYGFAALEKALKDLLTVA